MSFEYPFRKINFDNLNFPNDGGGCINLIWVFLDVPDSFNRLIPNKIGIGCDAFIEVENPMSVIVYG